MVGLRSVCIICVAVGLFGMMIFTTMNLFSLWQRSEANWSIIIIWIAVMLAYCLGMIGLMIWSFEDSIEHQRIGFIRCIGPYLTWILTHGPNTRTNIMKEAVDVTSDELIDALIETGIHRVDHDGWGQTPIHHACEHGNRRMVQRLIVAHPPFLEMPDGFTQSPLEIAIRKGHHDLVIDLIRMGAQYNHEYLVLEEQFRELFQAVGWFTCALKPERVRQIRQRVYFEQSLVSRLLPWIDERTQPI